MANKFSLFGFSIARNKSEQDEEVQQSFTPPSNDDGALTITSAAYYGTYVDLDGTAKNDVELITRYREMAMQPEIESAIDDIVGEAICQDDNGKTIDIVLDGLKQPDKIKNSIKEEFKTILRLLNYKNMSQDIFRRFYVDGRLFYHMIIDRENPMQGIKELRYVDPRKLRKVREIKKVKDPNTNVEIQKVVNEYYIYNDKVTTGTSQKAVFKNDVLDNESFMEAMSTSWKEKDDVTIKGRKVRPKIGFSDDDPRNVEKMKEFLSQEYPEENPVNVYLTKGGEKIRYNR